MWHWERWKAWWTRWWAWTDSTGSPLSRFSLRRCPLVGSRCIFFTENVTILKSSQFKCRLLWTSWCRYWWGSSTAPPWSSPSSSSPSASGSTNSSSPSSGGDFFPADMLSVNYFHLNPQIRLCKVCPGDTQQVISYSNNIQKSWRSVKRQNSLLRSSLIHVLETKNVLQRRISEHETILSRFPSQRDKDGLFLRILRFFSFRSGIWWRQKFMMLSKRI